MNDDLVKRLRDHIAVYLDDRGHVFEDEALCDDAADRIEELEAANRGLVRLNEVTQARADNHWETLRSIRHIAETTGDLPRITQWVSDAAGGYAETADVTLAAEMDRRAAAEAKLAQAVEALGTALSEMVDYADTHPAWSEIWEAREAARITLAELKGEK